MSDKADVVAETTEILGMFAAMKRSYDALSGNDKQKIDLATGGEVRFGYEGFDGNHDPHIHVARDLIVNQSKFPELRDWADLNSHTQSSIVTYRRMLNTFRELDLKTREVLGVDEIIKVMWAREISSGGVPAN